MNTAPARGAAAKSRAALPEVPLDPQATVDRLSEAMRADEARRRQEDREQAQRILFDMD